MLRFLTALTSAGLLCAVAWLGRSAGETIADKSWSEIAPGVLRSAGMPCGYAILDGDSALVIGAPRGVDPGGLAAHGVKSVELGLLTHHHRDSVAAVPKLLATGAKVRAPKASADWLTPDGVQRYWKVSLPVVVPGQEVQLRDRTFGEWEGGGDFGPGAIRPTPPGANRSTPPGAIRSGFRTLDRDERGSPLPGSPTCTSA